MTSKTNSKDIKRVSFAAKIDTDRETRTVTATISTDVVDRDKEVLQPKGLDLTNYRKNPVVLWAHDYSQPPIGKNVWIKKDRENGRVMAKTQFADTPMGNEIFALYDGGFLKTWSVGFIPGEGHAPNEKEIAGRPDWAGARWIYDKWELLEYSAVPVPSNPEALTLAMAKGLALPKELQEQLPVSDTVTVEEGADIPLAEGVEEGPEEAEVITQPSVIQSTGDIHGSGPSSSASYSRDAFTEVDGQRYINESIPENLAEALGITLGQVEEAKEEPEAVVNLTADIKLMDDHGNVISDSTVEGGGVRGERAAFAAALGITLKQVEELKAAQAEAEDVVEPVVAEDNAIHVLEPVMTVRGPTPIVTLSEIELPPPKPIRVLSVPKDDEKLQEARERGQVVWED